jgi:3-mercaptopyruvate sulfurtransferase SseA
MDPGSWHDWHLAWKIGATSLENVTVLAGAFGAWAKAVSEAVSRPAAANAAQPSRSVVPPIVNSLVKSRRRRAAREKTSRSNRPGPAVAPLASEIRTGSHLGHSGRFS